MKVNQKDINLHGDRNKKENGLGRTNTVPITDSITEPITNSKDEISQLLRKFDIRAIELSEASSSLKNAYDFLRKGKETKDEKLAIECFKNAHQTLNIAGVPLRVAPPLKYWEEEDIEGALGACLRLNTRVCINEIADKNINTDPLTACQLYSMIGVHDGIKKVIERLLTKESEYIGISRSISLAVEISVEYNINLMQLMEERGLGGRPKVIAKMLLLEGIKRKDDNKKMIAVEKMIEAYGGKEGLFEVGMDLIKEGQPMFGLHLCKIAGAEIKSSMEEIAEEIEEGKLPVEIKNKRRYELCDNLMFYRRMENQIQNMFKRIESTYGGIERGLRDAINRNWPENK